MSDWDGVPLVRPEHDGWHWLEVYKGDPRPWWWIANSRYWSNREEISRPCSAFTLWRYIGPALTPTEVAAKVREAELRGFEQAILFATKSSSQSSYQHTNEALYELRAELARRVEAQHG